MLWLALLLLLLGSASQTRGQCTSFQSDLCSDVIQSYTNGQVYGSQAQLALTEMVLVNLGMRNISIAGPIIFPECFAAAKKFVCGHFFPMCSQNGTQVKVCKSICLDFMGKCESMLKSQGLEGQLPSCSLFDDNEGCNELSNMPTDGVFEVVECPPPLVLNFDGKERPTCPGGQCCLPCPATDIFFEEGYIDRRIKASDVFAAINTFLMLFVTITYLVIPEKRNFPTRMITFMTISCVITYLQYWIGIFTRHQHLCNTPIDPASEGDANPTCEAQAFLLTYGGFSCILWFSVICFNVFLIVFFRKKIAKRYEYLICGICWGVPLIPSSILVGLGKVGYTFAPICGIPDPNWLDAAYYYPIAVVIFATLGINAALLFKVVSVSRKVKQPISKLLQMQLRPLLFSIYSICIFLSAWIYQATIRLEENREDWLPTWFFCIALGQGQAECAKIPAPFLDTTTIFAIYYLYQTLGLVAIVLFVLKKDILDSWKKVLRIDGNFSILPFTNKNTSSLGESTSNSRTTQRQFSLHSLKAGSVENLRTSRDESMDNRRASIPMQES